MFEFIFEMIFEMIFEIIGYPIGWFICRVITFGKYPKGGIFNSESDSKWVDMFISMLGLAAIVAVTYFIF